jgi:hypothetical protein
MAFQASELGAGMIATIHGLSSTKTDPEFLLSKIRTWVEEYVHLYDSNAAAFQENIDLKAEHTRRVCEVLRGNKYLEAIRNAIPPKSFCIIKAYERAHAHLERNAAAR